MMPTGIYMGSQFARCCGWMLLVVTSFAACRNTVPDDVQAALDRLPDQVDFNFDIRPILADRCYACHGPDAQRREADLRLDQEVSAFASLDHGGRALVPGDLSRSLAWQRIISPDPEQVMPPPSSHLSLTTEEKALIARWIETGSAWKDHWSFVPPVAAELPADVHHPIDYFVRRRLQALDLSPAPPASRERLLRRVTIDLTGLPPTLEQMDAFLADTSEVAYERMVDKLLQTDVHAERMAMEWLDVARYADSHGQHADGLRIMWPWRDWVIAAFRRNMSYDTFVTWQLAGDLLPGAGTEQKLATGFHRNHVTNSESGIVPEEFRVQYVVDRTNTTATAFMGLTLECAQCHDHKFDPISQREYYSLSAFFNQVHELGMIGNDMNWGPTVLLPDDTTKSKIQSLRLEIQQQSMVLANHTVDPEALQTFIAGLEDQPIGLPTTDAYYPLDRFTAQPGTSDQWLDGNPDSRVEGTPELVPGQQGNAVRLDSDYDRVLLDGIRHFDLDEPFSAGSWVNVDTVGTFQTILANIGGKNDGWRGWIFYLDTLGRPGFRLVHSLSHNYVHVVAHQPISPATWHQLYFTYDGSASAEGLQLYVNGREVAVEVHFDRLYKNIQPTQNRNYIPDPKRSIRMGFGSQYLFSEKDDGALVGAIDQVRLHHRYLTAPEVAALYTHDTRDERTSIDVTNAQWARHYQYRMDPDWQHQWARLCSLKTQYFDLVDPVQEVMVMADKTNPRPTYVLERGRYDMHGEEVNPNTPAAILPFSDSLSPNRLGLAQWLFDPAHPLTARVAVNRYWQMFFGRGIVETTHDFGSQGALPTHPKLLDWLAIWFRDSGWDLRALIRLMVTSDTYRQSVQVDSVKLALDPENKYLSRGPSYRWPAEVIRDNALAASGLLNQKIGGPSVKPYQPPDLWKEKNEFSGYLKVYKPDTGQDLYRRSMYTFIRRTVPPPAMIAFDATDRSVCTVRRETTNTPQQALVLMNDPQFVEAARVLAVAMQKHGGEQLEDQLTFAWRRICGRYPDSHELTTLKTLYRHELERFKENPKRADQLLSIGEFPFDYSVEPQKTAALAMVNNAIMNFDEAYMKR